MNIKFTLAFLVLFILVLLSKGGIYYFLLLLSIIFYFYRKYYLAIFIFLFSIFIHFNPSISTFPINIWDLYLMIVFILIISFIKRYYIDKLEIIFFSLIVLMVIFSIYTNPIFSISLIKGVSIIIYVFILFSIFRYLAYIPNYWFIGLIEAIIIFNFFLLFTNIGYYPRNGLFMGVFDHSQSIGVFLAPLLVYYIIDFFEKNSIKNTNLLFFIYKTVLIISGFIEIFASYSRTAAFSIFIPVLIYFLSKVNLKNLLKIFIIPRYTIFVFVILIVIFINFNKILDFSIKFLYKSYTTEIFQSKGTESILSSREALYERAIKNFVNNPIIGNGFGIQKENGKLSNNEIKYIPLLDVPYTMVNEKGNVYLAVLEEGGILAFTVFIAFILILLKTIYKYKPAFFSTLAVLISFNGEASLFSLNGMGAFQLALFIYYYHFVKDFYKEVTK